jgi:predicted metal-dependent peptidase
MAKKNTDFTEMPNAEELIEKTMVDLIFSQPFYATLLLNMRREITTKVPTLGVSVTDQVNLYINPYFFASLQPKERVEVLIHECLHVINNHFVRFRDLEPQVFDSTERSLQERVQDVMNASTLNQAADYAINEYLPNLPKKLRCFDDKGQALKFPEKDAKGNPHPKAGKVMEGSPCLVKELKKQIPDVKHREKMEYYYELLLKEQENNGQNQTGDVMVIDDHSMWHEGNATEDQITDVVKEVVNKSLEQAQARNAGNIPSEILEAIEKLNHVPKDWRNDLQRFVARQIETLKHSTRKKRHRRYGILYPGSKKTPKMKLVVAIDSSGSVSNEELHQFFTEINRIHNLNVEVFVIECDAQVNNAYEFDPKKPFEVKGRGGTQFAPVFDYIKEHKIEADGLIYLTDGECWESSLEKPKYPVMWAILKGYEENFKIPWGYRTTVEVLKKVRR